MHLIEVTPENNVVCDVYDRTMARVRIIVDSSPI
jgi:hypothetical protein